MKVVLHGTCATCSPTKRLRGRREGEREEGGREREIDEIDLIQGTGSLSRFRLLTELASGAPPLLHTGDAEEPGQRLQGSCLPPQSTRAP